MSPNPNAACVKTETTGFQGSIYADPSRKLYNVLGMDIENLKVTPAGEQKRSYIKTSGLVNAITSIWVRISSYQLFCYGYLCSTDH